MEMKIKEDPEKVNKLEIEFENLEKEQDYVTDRRDMDVETSKSKIASAAPFRVHLERDKAYFYCTCGESQLQPFCDGSHKGTGFKPLKFSIKHNVTWSLLCGCKRNDETSGPFCDGNHTSIDW